MPRSGDEMDCLGCGARVIWGTRLRWEPLEPPWVAHRCDPLAVAGRKLAAALEAQARQWDGLPEDWIPEQMRESRRDATQGQRAARHDVPGEAPAAGYRPPGPPQAPPKAKDRPIGGVEV